MKKLLLTGFEAFQDFSLNPTENIVRALDGMEIGNYNVFGRVLPVEFHRSADEWSKYKDEVNPDAAIALGLAAGRNRITPERIAINCNDGKADNKGEAPQDERIARDGPDAYFSTLPIRRFVKALKGEGYPAVISNTAGTYLCNNVMYSMLHICHKENRNIPAGFVHLPASHELALDQPGMPSWGQEDLQKAVEIMIAALT